MKRRKGLLLAADDLQVGRLVAIHHGTRQYRESCGASLQIALNCNCTCLGSPTTNHR